MDSNFNLQSLRAQGCAESGFDHTISIKNGQQPLRPIDSVLKIEESNRDKDLLVQRYSASWILGTRARISSTAVSTRLTAKPNKGPSASPFITYFDTQLVSESVPSSSLRGCMEDNSASLICCEPLLRNTIFQ